MIPGFAAVGTHVARQTIVDNQLMPVGHSSPVTTEETLLQLQPPALQRRKRSRR